jgi:hypothetical protein
MSKFIYVTLGSGTLRSLRCEIPFSESSRNLSPLTVYKYVVSLHLVTPQVHQCHGITGICSLDTFRGSTRCTGHPHVSTWVVSTFHLEALLFDPVIYWYVTFETVSSYRRSYVGWPHCSVPSDGRWIPFGSNRRVLIYRRRKKYQPFGKRRKGGRRGRVLRDVPRTTETPHTDTVNNRWSDGHYSFRCIPRKMMRKLQTSEIWLLTGHRRDWEGGRS